MAKRAPRRVLLVVLLPVALVAIHHGLFGTPSDPLKAWASQSPASRHATAERLLADETLIGMPHDELRKFLGSPGYVWDDGQTLGWYLGDPPAAGWFTMDMDYLEVNFADGKVVSARIWTSRW